VGGVTARSAAALSTQVADDALAGTVRERLVRSGAGAPDRVALAAAVRLESALDGDQGLLSRVGAVESALVGLGPLQALAEDAEVSDILVNDADQVWVERAGVLSRSTVAFPDREAVRRLAQRLASGAGRRLDDAQPWVDARLPGGVRLHAVLPPVAPDGPLISLRLPRRTGFRLDQLVAAGMCPAWLDPVLVALVRRRRSFLVTGGTGSGKTTLLATLLGHCRPGERLVLVEDLAELRPDHDHVVRLESRSPNVEGAGQVGLQQLVRQALRMRPDRLVVGEVRGAEVVDLLAALNTGHQGGSGTVHADRAEAVPARIEALATAAGLSRAAAHSQLLAGVEVIVHLGRREDGSRRVEALAVLSATTEGLARVSPAVQVHHEQLVPGPGWPALVRLLDLAPPAGTPA
jgi:pilus assembly protein CpaF